MFDQFEPLTPPKMLALAYVKRKYRHAFELILHYDVKLGQIFQNSSEPMIAQMKLAWWRDVISRPASKRPTGEPMLAAMLMIKDVGESQILADAMLRLVDAWDGLIHHEVWSNEILYNFAKAKSSAIFDYHTKSSGHGIEVQRTANEIGRAWAIADLLTYCRNENEVAAIARMIRRDQELSRLPASLRSLSILGFAAVQDNKSRIAGIRLIIHALTGR
jgi:15-cis-phytoene synthase